MRLPSSRSSITPAVSSVLKWWLAVDFCTGTPNLAALDLACLVALLGELAHDLEAHRVGERLEHGDAADGVEIGGGETHWLTMIV